MKIAVLGDLLYDCFIWADRLPRKGETVTGFKNGFFAGGKGGNQAVQAARLSRARLATHHDILIKQMLADACIQLEALATKSDVGGQGEQQLLEVADKIGH